MLAEKYLKVTGSMKGDVIKVKTLAEVAKPDTMM
jgi:hypothetical protein